MKQNSDPLAVLLIAFRRIGSMTTILDRCFEAGVKRIYVTIDLATNTEGQNNQESISQLLAKYQNKFDAIIIHKRDRHVGCAVSVLTGLDWIFSYETFICILEDDCIPSADFFEFVQESKRLLDSEEDLMLVCGSQFAPESLTKNHCVQSSLSLTWGWATTRSKWFKIRFHFFQDEKRPKNSTARHSVLNFLNPSYNYWNAGARRAYEGFVDVWDTILVRNLYTHKHYALLPPTSLVSNIGSDTFATHTKKSEWINLPLGVYETIKIDSKTNTHVEKWLRRHFFKIRWRHLLSTRLTALRDAFVKSPRKPLLVRWVDNQIIDS
jgi:hypothetical protein